MPCSADAACEMPPVRAAHRELGLAGPCKDGPTAFAPLAGPEESWIQGSSRAGPWEPLPLLGAGGGPAWADPYDGTVLRGMGLKWHGTVARATARNSDSHVLEDLCRGKTLRQGGQDSDAVS